MSGPHKHLALLVGLLVVTACDLTTPTTPATEGNSPTANQAPTILSADFVNLSGCWREVNGNGAPASTKTEIIRVGPNRFSWIHDEKKVFVVNKNLNFKEVNANEKDPQGTAFFYTTGEVAKDGQSFVRSFPEDSKVYSYQRCDQVPDIPIQRATPTPQTSSSAAPAEPSATPLPALTPTSPIPVPPDESQGFGLPQPMPSPTESPI